MRLRIHPWFLTVLLAGACLLGLFGIYSYRWRTQITVKDIIGSLPTDNAIVAFIDVSKLRAGGYLDLLMRTASTEELEYRNFVEDSHFDYRNDLDQVAVSFSGDNRYAVAVGRFDWAKLREFTVSRRGNCHNGFCEAPADDFGRMNSFYAIRSNIMGYGAGKGSGNALHARPGASPAHDWPDSPVWVRVPGTHFANQRDLPEGTKMFASAISATSETIFKLNGQPSGAVELEADMYCRDEAMAANLEKQLTDATVLLKKMLSRDKKTPSASDLSGVLASGAFRRDKMVVTAVWQLDRSFLRTLADGNL